MLLPEGSLKLESDTKMTIRRAESVFELPPAYEGPESFQLQVEAPSSSSTSQSNSSAVKIVNNQKALPPPPSSSKVTPIIQISQGGPYLSDDESNTPLVISKNPFGGRTRSSTGERPSYTPASFYRPPPIFNPSSLKWFPPIVIFSNSTSLSDGFFLPPPQQQHTLETPAIMTHDILPLDWFRFIEHFNLSVRTNGPISDLSGLVAAAQGLVAQWNTAFFAARRVLVSLKSDQSSALRYKHGIAGVLSDDESVAGSTITLSSTSSSSSSSSSDHSRSRSFFDKKGKAKDTRPTISPSVSISRSNLNVPLSAKAEKELLKEQKKMERRIAKAERRALKEALKAEKHERRRQAKVVKAIGKQEKKVEKMKAKEEKYAQKRAASNPKITAANGSKQELKASASSASLATNSTQTLPMGHWELVVECI